MLYLHPIDYEYILQSHFYSLRRYLQNIHGTKNDDSRIYILAMFPLRGDNEIIFENKKLRGLGYSELR